MKSVLIFGAAGMDGSHMIDYLLDNTDYNIYAISNKENLIKYPKRVLKLVCDITNFNCVESLIKSTIPEYCINFAAKSSVTESNDNAMRVFKVNFLGVLNILESIKHFSPNCKFSNMGSSEELKSKLSVYGSSKSAAHKLVESYRNNFNLFAIQPICYNHTSPRQSDNFFIKKLCKSVLRVKRDLNSGKEPTPIEMGNIHVLKNFSHSKDIVEGVWKLLQKDTPAECILANHKNYLISEIIDLAFRVAGVEERYRTINQKEELMRKDEEHQRANIDDTLKIIDWSPRYSLKDILEEIIDNLKNSDKEVYS